MAAGAFALAESPEKGAAELGGDVTLDALEREHIERVLSRAASEKEAARILGIDASTLYRKRKRYQSDG